MSNLVVKYNNNMNQVSFRNFNPTELDLLFTICSNLKEKGVNEVTYSFDKLKELSNYEAKDKQRFLVDLQSTYDKLIQLPFKIEDENKIIKFVLFTRYIIDKNEDTVTIKVNDDFSFILNELTSNFTRFELAEFTGLNSSYSKTMYRLLKQFRTTGYYKVSIDEFKHLFDVPKSYQMTNIDKRILVPIQKELEKHFNNLRVNKIKAKKGNKIAYLEFIFDKEQIPVKIANNAQNAKKGAKRTEIVPDFEAKAAISPEEQEKTSKQLDELFKEIQK